MTINKGQKVSRRSVIIGSAGLVGVSALRGFDDAAAQQNGNTILFTHGIASGDPLQDRVILWTRAVPSDGRSRNLSLTWQMSPSEDFSTVAASGTATCGPKTDYTVKTDATGLTPDSVYYFRFECEGNISLTGRTRTLPARGTGTANLAVVSCSNYPQGYFHVYREIAKRDFAAVLHLGDYIYEYPEGVYSNETMTGEHGRTVAPKGEVIALEDYRMRYGLYRSDPDLQAVHAAHPFICVWDDHEVANDTWRTGAENHNDNEGSFADRKAAAQRAYHEWLPIRENGSGDQSVIYRSFEIGDLATLVMLDTRLVGRDRPLDYATDLPLRSVPFRFEPGKEPVAVTDGATLKALMGDSNTQNQINHVPVPFRLDGASAEPILNWSEIQRLDPKNLPAGVSYVPDFEKFQSEILPDPSRSMLGEQQMAWLRQKLTQSRQNGKPWQILGQQVLSGKVAIPSIADEDIQSDSNAYVSPKRIAEFRALAAMNLPLNLDAWDGYPAAREHLFATIKSSANNAVLLAGDTHNAWAFDLADDNGDPVAVEFATAGVSSPGMEEYLPVAPEIVQKAIMERSPELKFLDSHRRGWLELEITADRLTARFQFISTVRDTSYDIEAPVEKTVAAGAHMIGS